MIDYTKENKKERNIISKPNSNVFYIYRGFHSISFKMFTVNKVVSVYFKKL